MKLRNKLILFLESQNNNFQNNNFNNMTEKEIINIIQADLQKLILISNSS